MDAEPFHRSVRPRDRPVRHQPHDVVGRLGVERHEVPERVVRRLRLRDLAIRVRLDGVDDVGELDPVLDEEDRHVVADQIEVALVRVELDREAAHVTNRVGRAARARDGREPDEHRRLAILLGQEPGLRRRGRGAVGPKHPVCRGATRVDDPLGDPLVVEVRDLLAEMEVLHQRRARGGPPSGSGPCPGAATPARWSETLRPARPSPGSPTSASDASDRHGVDSEAPVLLCHSWTERRDGQIGSNTGLDGTCGVLGGFGATATGPDACSAGEPGGSRTIDGRFHHAEDGTLGSRREHDLGPAAIGIGRLRNGAFVSQSHPELSENGTGEHAADDTGNQTDRLIGQSQEAGGVTRLRHALVFAR